jgi:hypothetical protein
MTGLAMAVAGMLLKLFPHKHNPWRTWFERRKKLKVLDEAEAKPLLAAFPHLSKSSGKYPVPRHSLFGEGHFIRDGRWLVCPFPHGSVARLIWIQQV